MFSISLNQFGTTSFELTKSTVLIPLFLVGTAAVITGVILEETSFGHRIQYLGWQLLVVGLIAELFASIGLFAIDGEISHRQEAAISSQQTTISKQQDTIIGLETAQQSLTEEESKTKLAASAANERAATLEKDAEDARLETAQIMKDIAPRRLEGDDCRNVIASMSWYSGTVRVKSYALDAEAAVLALEIARCLAAIHTIHTIEDIGGIIPMGGVSMGLIVAGPNEQLVSALRKSLVDAGKLILGDGRDESEAGDDATILVAIKPLAK
jgi:ABC-type multidrug transport system fused ATPase/permease subunit